MIKDIIVYKIRWQRAAPLNHHSIKLFVIDEIIDNDLRNAVFA